jgi:hypothetical protein
MITIVLRRFPRSYRARRDDSGIAVSSADSFSVPGREIET